MKKQIILSLSLIMCLQLNSQALIIEIETVDSIVTWPWNWDIASDQNRLITANKNGALNIKTNNVWDNLEVNSNITDIELRGVSIADDGTIWFTTTEHGLWAYNQNSGFLNYNSTNSNLPVNNLRSLEISNDNIWISTDNEGLIRFNSSTDEVLHFTKEEYPELKTNKNLDPYSDESGNIWFGNREDLTKINPNLEWTSYSYKGSVKDIHIVSESEIYIARDGEVLLFDGNNFSTIIEDQFRKFIQVFKDSRGDIWLSGLSAISGDGITVISKGQSYFFDYDENEDIPNQIFEFIEHQDTVIASGTIGNRIAKLVFDYTNATIETVEHIIRVFPNPTVEKLNIEFETGGDIERYVIFDLMGRKVKEGELIESYILVSNLSAGQYILRLESNYDIISKKITIANIR